VFSCAASTTNTKLWYPSELGGEVILTQAGVNNYQIYFARRTAFELLSKHKERCPRKSNSECRWNDSKMVLRLLEFKSRLYVSFSHIQTGCFTANVLY
jgi:hypothetical protein